MFDDRGATLRARAGSGAVADNLADALTALFESVAVAIVGLVISRDELRARLRTTTPVGIPLLTEASAAIASYLARERELGRTAADADVDALAPTLIGAVHLLVVGGESTPPEHEGMRRVVATVIAGVV